LLLVFLLISLLRRNNAQQNEDEQDDESSQQSMSMHSMSHTPRQPDDTPVMGHNSIYGSMRDVEKKNDVVYEAMPDDITYSSMPQS
jgi:hypothetical protein